MKNAVIAALSLALGFLLLQSLGAFQFGSGIDRNHRSHFVDRRTSAVERSDCWLLTTGVLKDDPISCGVLEGITCAVEMLNAAGGVLNKPFRLETADVDRTPKSHLRTVQAFCDRIDAAVYYGPTHTRSVPGVRALSQFQGLPCIAPMTPYDPSWAELSPDNYVSLYPPLHLWTDKLAQALASQNAVDKVLIVSPEDGSYGWLFANDCERSIRQALPHAEVFRYTYTAPLDDEELRHFIQLYDENRGLDAIVFTGEADDMLICARVQNTMNITLPVYGSDMLDIPDKEHDWQSLPFPLIIPRCDMNAPSPNFNQTFSTFSGHAPTVWNMLGAHAVFMTAQALRENQGYHPDSLVQSIRALTTRLWIDHPPFIHLVSFNTDKEKRDIPKTTSKEKNHERQHSASQR